MDNKNKKRSKHCNSESESDKEEEDFIHNQNCSSDVLNQIMKSLANLELELSDIKIKSLANLEQEIHTIKTSITTKQTNQGRSNWHNFVRDKQQDLTIKQWFKDNNVKPQERLGHIAKLWKKEKQIEP